MRKKLMVMLELSSKREFCSAVASVITEEQFKKIEDLLELAFVPEWEEYKAYELSQRAKDAYDKDDR